MKQNFAVFCFRTGIKDVEREKKKRQREFDVFSCRRSKRLRSLKERKKKKRVKSEEKEKDSGPST